MGDAIESRGSSRVQVISNICYASAVRGCPGEGDRLKRLGCNLADMQHEDTIL